MEQVLMQQLTTYIDAVESNGHRQRTPGWIVAKAVTSSGTDAGVLLGVDPYRAYPQLLYQKAGLTTGETPDAACWGTMCEPIITRVTEIELNTKIIGDNSFVIDEGGIFSYSPDGVGVADLGKYSPKYAGSKRVLFEFKCPYSRMPTAEVPKYYLPQIKQGLELLPVDIGMFVQAVIRRCSWEQLETSGHTPVGRQKPLTGPVISYGLVGLWSDSQEAQGIADELVIYGHAPDYDCIDLGDAPVEQLMTALRVLNKADSVGVPLVSAWYSEPVNMSAQGGPNAVLEQYKAFCAQRQPRFSFGIIPWKLYQIYFTPVEREVGFLDTIRDKAAAMIEVIQRCQAPGNELKKENIIKSHISKLGYGFVVGGKGDE